MSKKLNVYWYKVKEGSGNFGDELNHYIIAKLSGHNIDRILIPSTGLDYIFRSLSSIYHGVISFKDIEVLVKQFFINDFISGIGSIIPILNSQSCKVWGSGIISRDDKINPATFLAVRGRYTQNRLRELNLPVPEILGDPALLLPIIYPVKALKKFKLGIVPHHIHYESISEKVKSDKIIVINLTNNIEKIINEIASCEYIISTSLHGIIVSQAYSIPSLWYAYKEKSLYGDNIKFYDYFSAVGIDEYSPFNLIPEKLELDNIIALFKNLHEVTLIKKPLEEIQKSLIKVAPFNILDKYKS